MKVCTAATESLTYAMKAKRVLSDAGIAADIVKPSTPQSKRGCEYGISFDCSALDDVKRILTGAGVRPRRYLKGGGELI